MTTLELVGLISCLFTVGFTAWACSTGTNPRLAIAETWVNILIGFSINFLANLVLMPLMTGHPVSASANWWGGWAYTAISVLRQYAIRRWFQNRLHSALASKLSDK
jgi:uncharacterized membrane protein YagU involved in acid resistance